VQSQHSRSSRYIISHHSPQVLQNPPYVIPSPLELLEYVMPLYRKIRPGMIKRINTLVVDIVNSLSRSITPIIEISINKTPRNNKKKFFRFIIENSIDHFYFARYSDEILTIKHFGYRNACIIPQYIYNVSKDIGLGAINSCE